MLGEVLKPILQAYFLLEERYYNVVDGLEEKYGVPVYEYFIEPVESKGIPSFLIVALLFLLLVGGSLVVLTASRPSSIQVVVLGKLGTANAVPLEGALVDLSDETGVLYSKKTVKGQVKFDNVPLKSLFVHAVKDGFKEQRSTVDSNVKTNVRLELACDTPKTCIAAFFESGVNPGDLNLNASPDNGRVNAPDFANGTGVDYLGPGDNQSNLTFSNLEPDSPTGRLLIILHDRSGSPLDGRATVYDAKTQAAINFVDVTHGTGLAPNLDVGRQVYVDAFSEGFAPYFGNATVVPIRPATNRLAIVLDNGTGGYIGGGNVTCVETPSACLDNGNSGLRSLAGVKVIAQNGSAIVNAHVSVYALDRMEVLYSDYSDSLGFIALTVGNGSYFATADADGFLTNYSEPFKANQTAVIVLPAVIPDNGNAHGTCTPSESDPTCNMGKNEARVLAHAVDQTGANASYADVVLQVKTDFGKWFVQGQHTASGNGAALFSDLLVGTPVKVLAALYDQNGSASATLVQGVNRLELNLSKPPFQVKAYAYDPLGRQYVANASFASFDGNKTVGSCQGNGCRLTMVSGQDVRVNVSADGYIGTPDSFNLYEGIDQNITLYLVSSAALKDTFIQWQGLYEPDNHAALEPLKPGHSYLAKVKVFSKNADQTGVVLDTQDGGAAITGVDPVPYEAKGSYSGSCSASAIDFVHSQDSWADVRYNGAASGTVTFNVTLDPQIPLDLRTQTKTLSLHYRSYAVRGADYLRSPYDPALTTRPAEANPSGCSARAYEQNYTVKNTGTTCNGQACVSLRFAQGDQESTGGLDAHSQILADNGTKLDPLYVYYAVQLFAVPNGSTTLAFQAPSSNIVLFNATTPYLGKSTLGTGLSCDLKKGADFSVWGSSFTLNLSQISKCTNFGLPFRMDGMAKGRVLQSGIANLSLSLNGVNGTLTHSGLVNVAGFGVAANDFAIVEAALGQPQNQNADSEPFPALSTGNCTADLILNGKCDVGFVNASYRITALAPGSIFAKIQNDGPLQLYDQQPNGAIPALSAGQSLTGFARFLVPATRGSSAISISRDLAGLSTVLVRNVTVGGSEISFNASDPFPPGWDTCNGYIGIQYTSGANPPLSLGKGCTDLGLRVSPVFPADATLLNVSIPDYGQVLTRVSETDGSDSCYEICELGKDGSVYGCDAIGKTLYSGTQYLLRYNPELKCTSGNVKKFMVNGNRILGSKITLEFGFTGDQSIRRNVTLHVLPDLSDPALYISPVDTFLKSGSGGAVTTYPQLWAVTNLKQLGPRKVQFIQPSNFVLNFPGPGTQVVAVNPGSGGSIQVVDGSDLSTPVFEYGNAASPIRAVSRYGSAAAALSYQLDLGTPYAQALSNLLSETISSESFMSKNVAESLSASVPSLSQRTAYWRSNDATKYCQQTPACVQSGYTLPDCCRESLEQWKNYTVQAQFQQQSCVFCNNTFNPSCADASFDHVRKYLQCTYQPGGSQYQCDQRCTAKTVFPPDIQARFDPATFPGSGVTLDVLSGNRLRYGDVMGGRTCQMQFSSLNAFVQFTPGSYTYYVPSAPLTKITDSEISRCQANGGCPLMVQAVSTGFGSVSATPECAVDTDGDGLWQPGELLSNASAKAVTDSSRFSSSSSIEFYCPAGQIIAVGESAFFQPAMQGGVIPLRNVITAADLQRCKSGLCPLVMNLPSAAENPGVPICFTDYDGNGLLDDAVPAEMNSLVPAIPAGFGVSAGNYVCPSGQVAVSNFCLSSCENYCSAPNCDPDLSCLPSGVKNVATGQSVQVFNGWLNQSPVVPVQASAVKLSRGKKYLPAALFPDVYAETNGKPVFTHSYIVNTKAEPGALSSLSKVVSIQGCSANSDAPYDVSGPMAQQGVYEIKDSNVPDVSSEAWTAAAAALDVPLDHYVGARSDICRKPNWNTKMCETTFVDYSGQFGGCFNSILQYSGADKKFDVDLPLIGGLGYGVKNGLGYGVSPSGHVFAQLQPGSFDEVCGSGPGEDPKHKYHHDYQTLYHWYPEGQRQNQMDFKWSKDLGCSKDCGCTHKGYGFFDFILNLLGFGNNGNEASSFSGIQGFANIPGVPIQALQQSIINAISGPMAGPNCKAWSFGDTVAYACKNTLWQISGV